MKKIIGKRLQSLSAFIEDNEIVIDIGCDHALLGIYLTLNRHNIKVISSDIHTKPLQMAKENIQKYHLEDVMELRLGNGLEVVTEDIETVVISGMGGKNMIEILQSIHHYPHIRKVVLSPNNDFPLVRKAMTHLGFKIISEIMVWEKGKYYAIMEFIQGKERISNFFGKLDLHDKVVNDYYQGLYDNNVKILKKLSFMQKIKRFNLIKENILIIRRLRKWKEYKK